MFGLPVLFLDVDGPLIPFGGSGYPDYGTRSANPLLSRVDPNLGTLLAQLPCQLVWATSWLHDANIEVAPVLGLPSLDVVEWPADEADEPGLHWKTRALVAWARDRPFVWVDDEITGSDRAWVGAHVKGPALLHRVDPRVGLTAEDIVSLREWLSALRP